MRDDQQGHAAPPTAYVVVRIQEALATDPRVGELGIVVADEGSEVVLRGSVSTATRKAAVGAVAERVLRDLGDDRPVRDETTVPSTLAPEGEETLA
jgi:hypothetical protein